jgi:hypothetical protein
MFRKQSMKRSRGKAASAIEKRHLDRLTDIPCLACGRLPIERHHVTGYADRMGRLTRRNDRVVPLCAMHHRVGAVGGFEQSVEALNHRGFFMEYGIDLMAEAERLWNETLERLAA